MRAIDFPAFLLDVLAGVHRLPTDILRFAFVPGRPPTATEVIEQLAPIALDVLAEQTLSVEHGTVRMEIAPVTIAAGPGGVGRSRYAVLYNASALENAKGKTGHPVIRGFDLGKGAELGPGEKLQIAFPSGVFTFGEAPQRDDLVL